LVEIPGVFGDDRESQCSMTLENGAKSKICKTYTEATLYFLLIGRIGTIHV
jgi:hypothetical protein